MRVDGLLERVAEQYPAQVAVVADGQRSTYRQLDERANRLARVLMDAGVRRGDRVVITLDNSVEAVVAVFAVLKAGAVFVLVSPRTRAQRLREITTDSGASLVVTRASFAELEDVRPSCPLEGVGRGAGERTETELAALVYTVGFHR